MAVTSIEYIGVFIVFLFSLIIHEIAHARIAYYLGDSTAKDMGMFSFNPLKHLNLIGILVPISLCLMHLPMISFAKPVMFKESAFKRPKIDMILVGLAGPISNLILAAIGFLLYNRLSMVPETMLLYFNKFLLVMVSINLVLCAFNLIPIPPLDGSIVYMSTLIDKKPVLAEKLRDCGVGAILSLVVIMPFIGKFYGKDYDIISPYINWFIHTFDAVLSPWIAKS